MSLSVETATLLLLPVSSVRPLRRLPSFSLRQTWHGHGRCAEQWDM